MAAESLQHLKCELIIPMLQCISIHWMHLDVIAAYTCMDPMLSNEIMSAHGHVMNYVILVAKLIAITYKRNLLYP